jgi:small subunit ribosomal protein S1
VILSIGEHDLIVDIGAKTDATVPPQDLDLVDEEYVAGLHVGDSVPVYVMQAASHYGGLTASLNLGLRQKDWLRAQGMLDSGEVVEEQVKEVNRGGVVVKFGQIRGFVPNSHLTSVPRGLRGDRLRQAKSGLVGQVLQLSVIEVDQRKRDLVLSERVVGRRAAEQILCELQEGDIRNGTVASIVEFGAFVNLGGVDGLIHISELDWAHVEHPRDVVAVGEEIQVYVISVDRERKRVSLSRKRLMPDPWHTVAGKVHPGDAVDGRVTGVASFGFFVDVGDGVEGLVHRSEIAGGPARLIDIEPGSKVTVRVLSVDEWNRRIALRLEETGPAIEGAQIPAHREGASRRMAAWVHA